jgi:hypothetical protein
LLDGVISLLNEGNIEFHPTDGVTIREVDKTGKIIVFVKLEKDELIKELMEYTIKDITAIYDELENGLNESTKNAIKKFLEEYDNPYDEYIDTYNNKYPDIVSFFI